MRRRDLERRLRGLGHQASPPPREELVEDVAARLRMQGPPPRSPARRTLFRPVVLAAATAAVLVLLVLVVQPDTPPLGSVTLAGSADSTVELPDGSVVDAAEGLVVPEGSVVRTGPDGHVRADGMELGPDSEAHVSGGRLLVAPPPTEPEDRPAPADPPRPTARPTAAPDPPRPAPEPTGRPAATPAPTRPPGELHLRCEPTEPSMLRADDRTAVACGWPATRDPRFASYELWRSDGEDRLVVFRTDERDRTRFTDMRVRSGQTYTYVIRALDARGEIIASGGPVRVVAR